MEEIELYIDRLKTGEYKEYSYLAPPEIMEADDKEAIFKEEIAITVSATVANDHIVLNISIQTQMQNYCKICNDLVSHELSIEEKHVPFSLDTMKSGVFSLKSYIRELIFLNIPRYSECEGSCPDRAVIKKYLKQSDDPTEDNKE